MIKTVNDYLDVVAKEFPQIKKEEIKIILNFGFRMYHYINRAGCDMLIKDDSSYKYTMFTGDLGYSALKHYTRGLFKWRMKERMFSRLRKEKWDGYYYLGLRESQHQEVLAQSHKNRKKINLEHAFFYKLHKEIQHDHSVKHIYRMKYPMDCGYKFYMEKYKVEGLEYIGENIIKVWEEKSPKKEITEEIEDMNTLNINGDE